MPVGIDECLDIARLGGAAQGETIFDVGANIGRVTQRFARQFPKSRICSFEPFPATYALLRRNTSRLSQVTCINQALGSRSEVRFAVAQHDSEWNSLLPSLNGRPDDQASIVEIQVTTIDQYCHENGISRIGILKTDTEGFDLEVLSGARRMLDSGSIDFVLSEAGFTKSDIRHSNFFDLHEVLEEFRFKFVSLYEVRLDATGLHFCNALYKHSLTTAL